VQFFKKHVPGFENAYLYLVSPYLGGRGGPCIEGEYTLTIEDLKEGRRFNDVLYIYFLDTWAHKVSPEGCDVPYRMFLPKKIDGLLVTGRGASYIRRGHDPQIRARVNLLAWGHIAGLAAALAIKNKVTPRNINVKELQKKMLKEGYYLGDEKRLEELKIN
jgi:hypothetical protein